QAERIEDLHLVEVNLVEAAVAAPLATRVGAVGLHELEVDGVVVELALGEQVVAVGVQDAVGDAGPAGPLLGTAAVKEDESALRCLLTEGRAGADGPLQGEGLAVIGLAGERAIGRDVAG